MSLKGLLNNFVKVSIATYALLPSLLLSAESLANPCAPVCCENICHEAPALPQAYNPSAYFDCGKNTCFLDHLKLRFDLLWWRASSCDLTLGYQEYWDLGAVNSVGMVPYESSAKVSPKPHFDLGYRVGLRYICPCDGWDSDVIYTHFHTTAKGKGFSDFTDGNAYSAFRPVWDAVDGNVPSFAEGKWKLDLDYLDFELGHKYFVSSKFTLRPFIGVRGARINQSYSYEASANRLASTVVSTSNHFYSNISAKNNFLGAGPRLGIDLEFDLGCNVVLYGQAAGSILYGRFENHSNELYNDFSTSAASQTPYRFNQHAPSDRTSGTMTDLVIGLKWNHCLCLCDAIHPVTLAVNWEHHGFYGFSGFERIVDDINYNTVGVISPQSPTSSGRGKSESCRGDFYTQGVTFSGTIGF